MTNLKPTIITTPTTPTTRTAKLPTGLTITPAGASVDWLHLLVLGESNVGKTRFCGSAAQDSRITRVLLIDFEPNGARSAKHITEKLDVIPVRSFTPQLTPLRQYLIDICRRGLPTQNGEPPYDVVIVDSIQQAFRYAMQEVKMSRLRDSYAKWERGGRQGPEPLRPDQVVSIPSERLDYNAAETLVMDFLIQLSGLPVHILATCADDFKEEADGVELPAGFRPGLPRALARSVPQQFFKIMWLSVVNRKGQDGVRRPTRVLRVHPDETHLMVKDRGPDFPVDEIIDPTMEQVFNYLLPITTAYKNNNH